MISFNRIAESPEAADIIADRLNKEAAAGKRLLWLLSGGSNIAIETAAWEAVPADKKPLSELMFCDERFGPVDHPDSNMKQLIDAGFDPGEANLIPTLTQDDMTLEGAASRYRNELGRAFQNADCIIAQIGMGTDGHILGILPGSPAVDAEGLVTSYHTERFDRFTMTFDALKRVTAVYAFAFGGDKRGQLETLRDKNLPLTEQPAQFLKQCGEVYVYNDQIGG